MDPDLASLQALQQRSDTVDVECLVQRVVDGLTDQHVIRNLDGSDDIVLTGGCLGKHRGEQIIGFHALNRRRIAPAIAEAQHHQ